MSLTPIFIAASAVTGAPVAPAAPASDQTNSFISITYFSGNKGGSNGTPFWKTRAFKSVSFGVYVAACTVFGYYVGYHNGRIDCCRDDQ